MSKRVITLSTLLVLVLAISSCSSATSTNYNYSDAETDAFAVGLNRERDYLTIVNEDHEYDFGGVYDVALQPDLIYVSDFEGAPTPLEKGTNTAFSLLKQYLHSIGVDIELYSGYRTKDDQQWVYDYYSNLEGWAENNKVLSPGFSEHHTGLLLNIVIWWPSEENPDDYVWTTETAERQAKDSGYQIVRDALADFGFIERYPAGKEDITGLPCEPYEIRFVGSSKVAHEIMDNDLCLEEYVETLQSK